MKTKTKEIVIKSIEHRSQLLTISNYEYYLIETSSRLDLDALDHVIYESVKVPESLDEWMEVNGVGKIEIVEFLNNNYKKQ